MNKKESIFKRALKQVGPTIAVIFFNPVTAFLTVYLVATLVVNAFYYTVETGWEALHKSDKQTYEIAKLMKKKTLRGYHSEFYYTADFETPDGKKADDGCLPESRC